MPRNTKHIPPERPMVFCQAMLLAITLCVLLSGCQEAKSSPPVHPVVKAMRISLEIGADNRSYPGVIVARHETQESFRVGGRIEKRSVDVGDAVREGQVLATLDEKDLRLSMESAQAERNAAVSNKDQAITEEQRYATLLSKNVVSQSEYDLKHLSAEEARARLDKADRSLKLATSQLGYARLVSSNDGVVTKVSAEAGQVVSPGQSVVTVARKGALEVLVDIPERSIQGIKETKAEASVWSNNDIRFRARLREIAPSADPATRTYAVRYALPDADASVRLGMTATLHLSGQARAQTARIPASAMLNQGKGPGLWRVDPKSGQLTFLPVTVDRYSERDAFVHGQLADGDIIVISGVQKLDEGTAVRLADAPREDAQ
ncbi:MAG: RND family efflux transporter, MFP subunit [Solidesulfovibrio magneticus str. Maddingley MBC34]|uniref:RND family efflux transporter, MFP subunit n=1 Tax=Solidesulfovibrio magneticus str. Maddingley MBC34 TaxID=1206767 RepID=K6FKM6_9BACT|nr:MAG: RND family efflux transporter, MFP subunit [Solidesulfovibrio magneticus str. Maddingley MBC34]